MPPPYVGQVPGGFLGGASAFLPGPEDVARAQQDEEERQRKKQAALAQLATMHDPTPIPTPASDPSAWGSGRNAPAAVAGGGPIAALSQPGQLWGPELANMQPTARTGLGYGDAVQQPAAPAFAPPPAMNPQAMAEPPANPLAPAGRQVDVQMGPYRHDVNTVNDAAGTVSTQSFGQGPGGTPGVSVPLNGGGAGGPVSPDMIQRTFQSAFERHKQNLSGGAMFPQPELLDRAAKLAQGETEPLMQQAVLDNRLKEAQLKHNLDHSPEAFAKQQAQNAFGAAMSIPGASAEQASAASMLAYKNALEGATALHGTTMGGSPLAAAATGGAGAAPPNPLAPPGRGWQQIEADLKQRAGGADAGGLAHSFGLANQDLLPSTVQISGQGKGLPPISGKVPAAQFGQQQAGPLIDRINSLARENPDAAQKALEQIGRSSPEAKKALLGEALAAQFAFIDPQKIPRTGGGITDSAPGDFRFGDMPDVRYGVSDKNFAKRWGSNLDAVLAKGGMPYDQATLPSGQTVPLDTSAFVPGRFNSDTTSSIRQKAAANLPTYQMILRAYGGLK